MVKWLVKGWKGLSLLRGAPRTLEEEETEGRTRCSLQVSEKGNGEAGSNLFFLVSGDRAGGNVQS